MLCGKMHKQIVRLLCLSQSIHTESSTRKADFAISSFDETRWLSSWRSLLQSNKSYQSPAKVLVSSRYGIWQLPPWDELECILSNYSWRWISCVGFKLYQNGMLNLCLEAKAWLKLREGEPGDSWLLTWKQQKLLKSQQNKTKEKAMANTLGPLMWKQQKLLKFSFLVLESWLGSIQK